MNTAEFTTTFSAFHASDNVPNSIIDYLDDVGPDADSDAQHDHNMEASIGGMLAPFILPSIEHVMPNCKTIWLAVVNRDSPLYSAPYAAIWMPPEWMV